MVIPTVFGETVQLYFTPACGMGCARCSSKDLAMPEMSLKTLEATLDFLRAVGAKRVELFANEPLMHPELMRAIRILNQCGLQYAILTVGQSPGSPALENTFRAALEAVDPDKGSFVFSVDHDQETAEEIVSRGRGDNNRKFDYAFKALAFWKFADTLKNRNFSVRTNTVISRDNFKEVEGIIRGVAGHGFSASFCYEQTVQPRFVDLMEKGHTPEFDGYYRLYLESCCLWSSAEVEMLVKHSKRIIAEGISGHTRFNTFRSGKSSGDVPAEELIRLRQRLLEMKNSSLRPHILPSVEFISNLGDTPPGCIELLRQGRYPQLKIWPDGSVQYCCDLRDPLTVCYDVKNLLMPGMMEMFAETIRVNPYIALCNFCNPCDFSVNWVKFK